jgi:hypothetical protein
MKIDRATLAAVSNLVTALLEALDRLGAPQTVKDALTESGDCEHVMWWMKNPSEAEAFEKWFGEVKLIAKIMGWPQMSIDSICRQSWKETHFKNRLSPAQAWKSEFVDAAR